MCNTILFFGRIFFFLFLFLTAITVDPWTTRGLGCYPWALKTYLQILSLQKCNYCCCWHSCDYDLFNVLFFFLQWSLGWFIYLKTMGNPSCRPQSTVHMKQFNWLCNVVNFLWFLGALQHHQWPFVWVSWCYSVFTILS